MPVTHFLLMNHWLNWADTQLLHWKYNSGEWKQSTAAYFFSFLSSSFSLCHHHKHLCRHIPSHRCCFHLAGCHHRALCSSITLHCNAGYHPLHLWAGVRHLWQGQQHLHWYDCPVTTSDIHIYMQDINCVCVLFTLDIDECELFHNGQAGRLCLHACVNTPGGYRCSCPVGYNVTRDGRSCKGVFSSSKLCFTCHFNVQNLSSI